MRKHNKKQLVTHLYDSNDSSSDFRYEGTRKQSLGNIYSQQRPSQSGSSGALDNLMADLMSSMNDDIHLMSSPPPPQQQHQHQIKSNNCAACYEEFDYRDEVKTVGNSVTIHDKRNPPPN